MNLIEMWTNFQEMDPEERQRAHDRIRPKYMSLGKIRRLQLQREEKRRFQMLSPEDQTWIMGQLKDNWDLLVPTWLLLETEGSPLVRDLATEGRSPTSEVADSPW